MKKSNSLLSISDVELSKLIVEHLVNGDPHYQLDIKIIAEKAGCLPKRIKDIIDGKSSFKRSHLRKLFCLVPGNVRLLMFRNLCKKIDLNKKLENLY